MKTMTTFNEKLKLEFKVLLKTGKDGVWKFIEGAEELFTAIEHPNEFDLYVSQILAQVRKDKRFDFEQYKEVIRFVKEHKRLNQNKPQEDNDYIIL